MDYHKYHRPLYRNKRNETSTPIAPQKASELRKGTRIPVRTKRDENHLSQEKVEDSLPLRKNEEEQIDWKMKALQLQSEMANFRKRQEKRAKDSILNEQERLLKHFLSVADNLERALQQPEEESTLRQGIELTYREVNRILEAEGVTRLETIGHPFDPHWHEALSTVSVDDDDIEAGTIVEELEAGYQLKDKLLRAARVVVAE